MENGTAIYGRRVNYYETDRMGIVHHSNYIRYFEEARLDLMEKCGLDYKGIEDMGIIIPVTFVDCRYIMSLRYGDDARIESHFTKYTGIRFEVSYQIYREGSEELCTEGKTGHCFLNKEMRPIRVRREFPELHQKFLHLVEGESSKKGVQS